MPPGSQYPAAQMAMPYPAQPPMPQMGYQPGYDQVYSPTQVPSPSESNSQGDITPDNHQPSDPAAMKSGNNSMSAYERQQLALQESKMMQQLEELKQRKEMEESFRLSGELDENDGKVDDQEDGNGKSKAAMKGIGKLARGGMKLAVPAAGFVGSYFLMRAAMGNSSFVAVPRAGF